MKRMMFVLSLLSMVAATLFAEDEMLKPYTLAGLEKTDLESTVTKVTGRLQEAGFTVEGTYSPMQMGRSMVISVSHPALRFNVEQYGGLLGFASVLRVGLLKTDSGIEVSYTTPAYWGNAYYRNDYPNVEADYKLIDEAFRAAFSDLNESKFTAYGSKKGLSAQKLQKYHYMVAMPYVEDVVNLADDLSYEEAIQRIEERAVNNPDADIVYSVKYPEKDMALYGIALTGEEGEAKFLPIIDIGETKHTPFLPYEILVQDGKVVMLHGRYRIALSFPDLTMGTFMKIMSTPPYIAKTMGTLVEDVK